MRIVELTVPAWTFSVPRNWDKFEVRFSNDLKSGFTSFVGSKFMALRGSQLRGSGKKVDALFSAMVKQGFAIEVETPVEKTAEKATKKAEPETAELDTAPTPVTEKQPNRLFLAKHQA